MQSADAAQWKAAIQSEYSSLTDKQTWQLTPLPPGRRAISCKWVFKVKHHADGSIDRYKARLVARGFTQQEGVDYHETYAPVVKMTSIRVLLSIAAIYDLEVHQMDVKTAFLNGKLDEELYMQQPEGFVQPGSEHLVCRLQKTLYGLKQSPRVWYKTIDKFFTKQGFQRVEFDYGLYIIWTDTLRFIIALYVDDILLACNDMKRLAAMKQSLSAEYEMSDLGEAEYILGIKVQRDRPQRSIYLSQQSYIEEVLQRFDMHNSKPVDTPMHTDTKLTKPADDEPHSSPSIPYQSAVGSLMYALTCTRPDIAFAVSTVSRFSSRYTEQHWKAVKRIMRYLQRTKHYRLRLGSSIDSSSSPPSIELSAYCDADWASDPVQRRSTAGYAFFIGSGAVSWGSKLMHTPALSATEAEYMTATEAAKEAIWLRQLLDLLGFTQQKPTVILCDNQGAIALTKNPAHHSRTKHIELRHHYIRHQALAGHLELVYCPTEEMTADVLTKPLARIKHRQHCLGLGLINSIDER